MGVKGMLTRGCLPLGEWGGHPHICRRKKLKWQKNEDFYKAQILIFLISP